jgi:hypothetical protein
VEEKEEEEDRKIMTKGERGMGWLELKERKEWLARPMLVLKIGRGDDLLVIDWVEVSISPQTCSLSSLSFSSTALFPPFTPL